MYSWARFSSQLKRLIKPSKLQDGHRKGPENPIGYRALSDLYVLQKKDADALNVTRAGLKEQPDNFSCWALVGRHFRADWRL